MNVCPRCGNKDPIYFAYKKGEWYCRRCIAFNEDRVVYSFRENNNYELNLDYSLTNDQQLIANKLIKQFINNRNSLVHAVCGAGKTEIVYPLIEYVLSKGRRVGFAIPRKDVVIELFLRIKEAFPLNDVIALYGGNTKEKEGDIVILTMHQIYRYENYFDLLIADEIDAFPFKNNFVLENFFFKAVKGNYVMMSATPSKEVIKSFAKKDIFTLSKRFHEHEIPVPQIVLRKGKSQELYIVNKIRQFKKYRKPCLIFVPSIEETERIATFLSLFGIHIDSVHSQKETKTIIKNFKNGSYDALVTTSILERGITIKSLQVIIYNANNEIFTSEVLEQISGRVGRKKDDPYGEVIFLADSASKSMLETIKSIQKHNESLQNMPK